MADSQLVPATSFTPATWVRGLGETETNLFNQMMNQLYRTAHRNDLRQQYYDAKQTVRQLGIAIPAQLQRIETAIGWPAKAVDALERRIRWDGVTIPGAGTDALGLDEVFAANQVEVLAPQATTGALIHSLSWVFTTAGDTAAGEPPVLINGRSARTATGLWDARRHQTRAALSVNGTDARTGEANAAIMYLPDKVVGLVKVNGVWSAAERPHLLGRVPATFLAYRPSLERPFGRSKISRPVMSMTDQAVRTMLRTEVGAEFFSVPQRYLLDVDPGTLDEGTPGWAALIGHVLTMERSDEPDAKTPEIGQFAQQSMQPHTEHLRSIAASFAGEANLPVSSLGIIHDNPASDAAMHTAYLDLVQDAERAHSQMGWAWVQVAQLSAMIRDGLTEPTAEMLQLRAKFRDPANPTKASATDAVMKQVQTGVLPADSDVTLEQLGYDSTTIRRIQADRRRSRVAQIVANIGSAAEEARQDPETAALVAQRGVGGT